jgi:curved DNA-binding protein CbpA
MDIKDYYVILQTEPSAGMQEIKKAYRRLAKEYHPDKNPGNAHAAAQFAEIKEAYEVLTNPAKKEYYLQQRWYNQSIGKRKKQAVITPVNVLHQALELDRYVATLDVFRMDKTGLKEYIVDFLSDDTIDKLHSFHEPKICREITNAILRAAKPLPHIYIKDVTAPLYKLAAGDEAATAAVNTFLKKETKKYQREKYSLLTIVILTLVICFIIWLAG